MTALTQDEVDLLERLATRTVGLIQREYPNSIRLSLTGAPTGPVTPKALYPAFYGCYDWHSSVHSHWQLIRAMRTRPGGAFVATASEALDRTLTAENISVEMRWITARPGFEMPYGMAWLLQLCHELRSWKDDLAVDWLGALEPMESHAVVQFDRYCSTLTVSMRGGLHNQSAFSLGLVWDAVAPLRPVIGDAARRFFGADTDVDLRHEPSAADFLSPALGEADLMRRVLATDEFVRWLEAFAPTGFDEMQPVTVVDPSNGQLAHWAGLNLSRSWMLRAIADALPDGHRMVAGLRSGASAHAAAGLDTADHDDYMISHWVPTFAVYLMAGAAIA